MDFAGGNFSQLFEQVGKIQERIAQVYSSLDAKEVEAAAGGGMVTVKMTAAFRVVKVSIEPSVLAEGDASMVEDLVQAAFNEALRRAKEMVRDEMSQATGGLPFPFPGL